MTLSEYLELVKTTGCAHCGNAIDWVDDGKPQFQECPYCDELVWLIGGTKCVTDGQLLAEDPELWDQLHTEYETGVN